MKFDENNSVVDNIVVFYNSKTFMKVKADAFDIGKLMFSFGELDSNRKLVPGKSIDYYLDLKNPAGGKNGHVLYNDILTGKIIKMMDAEEKNRLGKLMREMTQEEKSAIPSDKMYAQPVCMYQGGQSAEKAKRSDGKALAKILKISRGSKQPIVFSCETGPGIQNEQGLIVPAYRGKPENIIRVSMTNDDLKTLALMVKAAYKAWLGAAYVARLNAENNLNASNARGTANWVQNQQNFFVCSCCGAEAEYDFEQIEFNSKKMQSLARFCPNCGKEMLNSVKG